MYKLYPILTVAAIISVFATAFIIAYALMKDKKEAIGFDRNMKDSEIMRRLLRYARPHVKTFLLIGALMLFSIAYDIISPILVGDIEQIIENDFEMRDLLIMVAIYASIPCKSIHSKPKLPTS